MRFPQGPFVRHTRNGPFIMQLDATLLARLQFTLTIMFHYLFPPLSIGLGAVMVFMEGAYLKTGNKQYEIMTKFWTKIFAVTFAMGVASGIVMEFQFGTNWSRYSRYVGDVFGSALAAEGIFAFFLESGFLAVLVFGWDRVSPKVHFFSTLMVSLGSIFSAVWIVVANSWQQTPAGFHIVPTVAGGAAEMRAETTAFWQVVFNPSSVPRFLHTVNGAFILGAFFIMSITAYYILRGRHLEFSKKSFTLALVFAAVVSLGQLALGHYHAVEVAHYQPEKLAAFEGLYKTSSGGTSMSLIGWPSEKTGELRYALAVPGLLSFLVYGNFHQPVPGLDKFPRADWPPVLIPYMSYHVMVALGMYFIALTLLGLYFRWRGTLFEKRWLMWVFVFSVVGPYITNETGWISAEVGRQPWSVYHLLRTSHSTSGSVNAWEIWTSIIMFSGVYALLFAVWIYVLNDKIQTGPDVAIDMPGKTTMGGLLEAASRLETEEWSMTESKPKPRQAGEQGKPKQAGEQNNPEDKDEQ